MTPNTDHVVRADRDGELGALYGRATVLVADGMPVVWASRLLGSALPERVAGVDLMHAVAAGLARRGGSAFLLGGTEACVAAAARGLEALHPGLRIAGTHQGFFRPDDPAVLRAVNDTEPDALLVGMGSPRQERWVVRHADGLVPRIVLCIGGGLEVVAGERRRAPRWMQRTGLEWGFRLAQEPGRLWRRYLVEDAAFVPVVYREWRSRRLH